MNLLTPALPKALLLSHLPFSFSEQHIYFIFILLTVNRCMKRQAQALGAHRLSLSKASIVSSPVSFHSRTPFALHFYGALPSFPTHVVFYETYFTT